MSTTRGQRSPRTSALRSRTATRFNIHDELEIKKRQPRGCLFLFYRSDARSLEHVQSGLQTNRRVGAHVFGEEVEIVAAPLFPVPLEVRVQVDIAGYGETDAKR